MDFIVKDLDSNYRLDAFRNKAEKLLLKMNSAGSRLNQVDFKEKVLMGGWTKCKPEQNMVKKHRHPTLYTL